MIEKVNIQTALLPTETSSVAALPEDLLPSNNINQTDWKRPFLHSIGQKTMNISSVSKYIKKLLNNGFNFFRCYPPKYLVLIVSKIDILSADLIYP